MHTGSYKEMACVSLPLKTIYMGGALMCASLRGYACGRACITAI